MKEEKQHCFMTKAFIMSKIHLGINVVNLIMKVDQLLGAMVLKYS